MAHPLTPGEDTRIKEGDPKRDSREGKFLADAAGRNNGPPALDQYDRDLLYFGSQKDVRRLRTIPRQGQEYSREPVRIPPERHKYGDTSPSLEGRTDHALSRAYGRWTNKTSTKT
jgi:hypothetical protein